MSQTDRVSNDVGTLGTLGTQFLNIFKSEKWVSLIRDFSENVSQVSQVSQVKGLSMIQAIDTDRIKQTADLRELAARSTVLRKESSRELSGPCPKCGGDDRFHVKADWWQCRQCYPLDNGKP